MDQGDLVLLSKHYFCNIFFSQVNFGKKAVALSVRQIKAGAEINDSYGSVYHHMDKAERQQFLQVSQESSKAKAYAYLIMGMQIVHDLIDTYICIIESIARFHEFTVISKAEQKQFLQVSREPSKAKVHTCLINTYVQGICACVLVL